VETSCAKHELQCDVLEHSDLGTNLGRI